LIGYYLTHPQVEINPAIPVPDWSLSPLGRQRIVASLGRPWQEGLGRIVASTERKAIESAELIAEFVGICVETFPQFNEIDRSSTGYLPHDQHDAAADQFFAYPESSWNGWERAVDTSRRIVAAVERLLAEHELSQTILLVGHGGVGTLLKCHLAAKPIRREADQPGGGGNLFAFRLSDRALLTEWTPLEQFDGVSDVA
jgi:broad specificity phosphatase PhoE